ncbi:nuclear transport factor 2 family protein [Gordonia polyisoprenivorans]|uniref:nuclear transport factor 2 family protein n=1 Tax=Gordonia polyisoprenivorans TaxID=84595 RepID=UPI001AD698E8|nr:nuclear transport factor 2 family protein [Gordonia polyisoprenivorans]QTI70917.1 nuclear transport factor 2 family protein [Gordonia polyisoprenivorans]
MSIDDWAAPSGHHRTHSAARRMPAPEGLSALDQLLAYEQIRQLANRYALAVNMRDLDALVDLFVDDVKAFGGKRGREALKEVFASHINTADVDVLEVTTHVINLHDADHATGTVYSRCEMGSQGTWARQSIAYEDRYERRDELWYFVNRNHLLFYGVEVPERPLDQRPANWPEHTLGRGSVPYDWESWQAARPR